MPDETPDEALRADVARAIAGDNRSRDRELAITPSPDWSTFRTFRKRPVIIHAVQFAHAEYAEQPHFHDLPRWLEEALLEKRVAFAFASEDYWYFDVDTGAGTARGGPDDWLVRGVEGELYPCRASVFFATFEPVA